MIDLSTNQNTSPMRIVGVIEKIAFDQNS